MKKLFRYLAVAGLSALALDTSAQTWRVDVNERGQDPATTTMPGFNSFLISSLDGTGIQTNASTFSFAGIGMTLSHTPGLGYDDRLRATPTNIGGFSDSLLLRDFVFSREATGTGGLDIGLTGLTPNLAYNVTIWSFDTGSVGTRVSDWFANGVLVRDNYSFDGATLPTSNNDYRLAFSATADNSGSLLIGGRRDPTSVTFGVFFNALELTPVPEPSLLGLLSLGGLAAVVAGRKRLLR